MDRPSARVKNIYVQSVAYFPIKRGEPRETDERRVGVRQISPAPVTNTPNPQLETTPHPQEGESGERRKEALSRGQRAIYNRHNLFPSCDSNMTVTPGGYLANHSVK